MWDVSEKAGSLTVDPRLLDSMRRAADSAYPDECCGVLLGRPIAMGFQVIDTIACLNVSKRPETRFDMAPESLAAAYRSARDRDLELVGFYHSHPTGPPVPSALDRESEGWCLPQLILGPAPTWEVKGWRIGPNGGLKPLVLQS